MFLVDQQCTFTNIETELYFLFLCFHQYRNRILFSISMLSPSSNSYFAFSSFAHIQYRLTNTPVFVCIPNGTIFPSHRALVKGSALYRASNWKVAGIESPRWQGKNLSFCPWSSQLLVNNNLFFTYLPI